MFGISTDLLYAPHGFSTVPVMSVRTVCFLYQEWFPIFWLRKVMLYVLINAVVTASLQGCFFLKKVVVIALAWFILCVWSARLGKKAIMCNFCCGQPQILVRLIHYDSLLRIFCTTDWCYYVFYNGFVTHLRRQWQGRWPPSELLDKRKRFCQNSIDLFY